MPSSRSQRPGRFRFVLAIALAGVWLAVSAVAAGEAAIVADVGPVALTVSDADRSAAFFTDVLTFEKVSDVEVAGPQWERLQGLFGLRMRIVELALGEERLDLVEYLAPSGRPMPPDSRANDRWFQHVAIIVSDMDRAYQRLREHKVRHASTGPQTLPSSIPNAAGIRAFYFRDPDGHFLEVLAFPPGKGDPRWHRPTDRLFLGIDHTAIVVDDTDMSLPFYRDVLGLHVAGESENFGTEQEHLNNVFGARLRITGLRAARGPGIELLEYLAPRDGRAAPTDLRPSDVAWWQTRLLSLDVAAAEKRLRAGQTRFFSPGLVTIPGKELGFEKGLLVRDPDGHAMQVVQ